jgi:hypothetical protein
MPRVSGQLYVLVVFHRLGWWGTKCDSISQGVLWAPNAVGKLQVTKISFNFPHTSER